MKELLHKRTETEKYFDTGRVKRFDLRGILDDPTAPIVESKILQYKTASVGGALHFQDDDGVWEDITLEPVVLGDGTRSHRAMAKNCQADVTDDGYTLHRPNPDSPTFNQKAWDGNDFFLRLNGASTYEVLRHGVNQEVELSDADAAKPDLTVEWSKNLTPVKTEAGYSFLGPKGNQVFLLTNPLAWSKADDTRRKIRRGTMTLGDDGKITYDIDLQGLEGPIILDPSGGYADTYDWTGYANSLVFLTARNAAAAGTFNSNSGTTIQCGEELFAGDANFYVYRLGIAFNVTLTGATISAATLDFYVTANNNSDTSTIYVVNGTWPNPAAAGDWDAFTRTSYGSKAQSTISTSAVNSWAFNATGLAAITQGASNKFTMIGKGDFDGTTLPVGADYIQGNSNGQATPPVFTITYTLPAPVITSITPSSGYNNATLAITDLAGSNLNGANPAVQITKSDATSINGTSVSQVSSIKVTCNLPITGATVGLWNVVYTDDNGSSTLPGALTILLAVPSVTSVSPSTSPNTEVITIMLTGSRLTGTNRVWFTLSGQQDVLATNVVVDSDSQVTCKVDFRRMIAGSWTGNVRNTYGSGTF